MDMPTSCGTSWPERHLCRNSTPWGENHLLHSSSAVQKVSNVARKLSYSTFDRDVTEVLRLAIRAARVTANDTPLRQRTDLNEPGRVLDARTGVLQARHATSRDIVVSWL
jgi:hypothetical protein